MQCEATGNHLKSIPWGCRNKSWPLQYFLCFVQAFSIFVNIMKSRIYNNVFSIGVSLVFIDKEQTHIITFCKSTGKRFFYSTVTLRLEFIENSFENVVFCSNWFHSFSYAIGFNTLIKSSSETFSERDSASFSSNSKSIKSSSTTSPSLKSRYVSFFESITRFFKTGHKSLI